MEIKKISDWEWEVPIESEINVSGIIFASEKLLEKMKENKCIEQDFAR